MVECYGCATCKSCCLDSGDQEVLMGELPQVTIQQLLSGSTPAVMHDHLGRGEGRPRVYRSCALLLAKASGRPMLPGADTPYLD
jgi:hypothetical protein